MSLWLWMLISQLLVCIIKPDYSDDQAIELLVNDTATATNRGQDKANEWLSKLKSQDVMTVGDLRSLQEEDWQNLYYLLTIED